MDMNEILERLGAESTLEMVHAEFDDKSYDEILNILNKLFTSDDNSELAEAIFDNMQR